MLPLKYRIRKEEDFSRIFKKGTLIRGRFVSLRKAENKLSQARVGFIVGQKIAKKSVERNRIKRVLSEIARLYVYNIKSGVDLIFLPTAEINSKSFIEIKEEIETLLKKI